MILRALAVHLGLVAWMVAVALVAGAAQRSIPSEVVRLAVVLVVAAGLGALYIRFVLQPVRRMAEGRLLGCREILLLHGSWVTRSWGVHACVAWMALITLIVCWHVVRVP